MAIIPARGGSKRLPRKNVIDYMGKPMIAYTIEAAQRSGLYDRIVVSTEDAEIAEVSRHYGAEVSVRDPLLATDNARVVDVCFDFLSRERQREETYSILSVLYATAPLRTEADMEAVLRLVTDAGFTSALAVTTYPFPVHQAMISENGKAVAVFPELMHKRADEVPTYYVDNGSTYSVTTEFFFQQKLLISPNTGMHVMPRNRSVDIDTAEDYIMAKFFGEHLSK